LAAVITDLVLEPDPLADYQVCPPECNLCVKSCPSAALGGCLIQQTACYRHAYRNPLDANGQPHETIVCNACRVVCPNAFGLSRERRELARNTRARLSQAPAVIS
jgi:epoxyqueuosine reductase